MHNATWEVAYTFNLDSPILNLSLQESNVFENGERSIASRNKFEGELQ